MGVYSNYDRQRIIQEAYYGKDKLLKQAEKILGLFRRKYMKNKYFNMCNTDPLLYEFEDILAEKFGFKTVQLDIVPAMTANAYTYPAGYTYYGSKMSCDIKKTKDGFKYVGENTPTLYMAIYSYLIFSKEYTDGEIMAILLHEIGHNFSHRVSKVVNLNDALVGALCVYNFILGLMWGNPRMISNNIGIFNAFKDERKKFRDKYLCNKVAAMGYNSVRFLMNLPLSIIQNIVYFICALRIDVFIKYLVQDIVTGLYKIIPRYIDERLADEFPAIYGYGPESAMADRKMGMNASPLESAIHKVPIVSIFYDMMRIPTNIIISLSDEHPLPGSRAKNEINYLKKELEKCNKPRLKKMLMEDIKRYEKEMEDIEKNCTNFLSTTMMTDVYFTITNKLKKGEDPRAYLASAERDSNNWDKMD